MYIAHSEDTLIQYILHRLYTKYALNSITLILLELGLSTLCLDRKKTICVFGYSKNCAAVTQLKRAAVRRS